MVSFTNMTKSQRVKSYNLIHSLTQSLKMNPTEEICSSWTVVLNKRSPKKTAESTNSNEEMNNRYPEEAIDQQGYIMKRSFL